MGNGSQGDRQKTRECHIRVLSNSQSSAENITVPIDKAWREGTTHQGHRVSECWGRDLNLGL